jgi:hypothetical protein
MTTQVTASEVIYSNLEQFAEAMVQANHPTPVDGLKPVSRRNIWGMRDTSDAVKSADLISFTTKNHPHGENSIYDNAARLGQLFEYYPPVFDFGGAVGSYADPKPAGYRYTEVALSEFARAVFFSSSVELRALPKKLNEVLSGFEPVYLIPTIPTALLYANNSIGYGDSSYTVPHNLADVCDVAIAFCQHMKTSEIQPFDHAKHAEKFLPDFPTVGTLTNINELLSAYRRGDFMAKIRMEGEVILTMDAILIKTLPYGTKFTGLDGRIEDLMREKGSWFDRNIQSVKDLSDAKRGGPLVGEIAVQLKRGVNVFEAWEQLRKKIKFSGSLTPIANYNEKGSSVVYTPPNLLRVWYDARYNILVSSKKLKITRLTEELRKVEARMVVLDNIDAVVILLRNNTDDVSIRQLQDHYNLTYFQAEYIVDTPLRILTTTARFDLVLRRDGLQDSLKAMKLSFQKIPDEMTAEIQAIKKKFPTPRRTKLPAYVGYVRISGGCIQIDTVDEIPSIVASFPKETLEIYLYDGPHHYRVTDGGKLEFGYIPKITTGDIYGLRVDLELNAKTSKVITVNFADGAACCVKGFVPGLRREGYFYTTPTSRVIRRNGTIETVEVTEEISLRKTICRGASTDIIYIYPDPRQVHYVLALNTTTPNTITIQRVTPERAKIAMNPMGTVYVVHSTDRHFFLNLPPEFLSRNTTRVAEFLDLEAVLDGKNQARLDIATQDVKKHKHIRLL